MEALWKDTALRLDLAAVLGEVYDLERLLGRLVTGSGNARDLLALAESLGKIPAIQGLFANDPAPLLTTLVQDLDPLVDFVDLIKRAIVDQPAITLRDGNLIRDGYHAELDKLRQARRGGKDWIRDLEATERQRTGIKSLKVGFNRSLVIILR